MTERAGYFINIKNITTWQLASFKT